MSETSPQTRAAAIAVAVLTLGGVLAGLIVPNVVTKTRVEYGGWGEGLDGLSRRCVIGTAILDEGPRMVGRLPLLAEGASPYCVYRACFDPGEASLATVGEGGTPAGITPLFAESEVPWQDPWPPLTVWCDSDDPDRPEGCACRPVALAPGGGCEWQQTDPDTGAVTWGEAPTGFAMRPGQWRGAGCHPAPCTTLAGQDWFPPACLGP